MSELNENWAEDSSRHNCWDIACRGFDTLGLTELFSSFEETKSLEKSIEVYLEQTAEPMEQTVGVFLFMSEKGVIKKLEEGYCLSYVLEELKKEFVRAYRDRLSVAVASSFDFNNASIHYPLATCFQTAKLIVNLWNTLKQERKINSRIRANLQAQIEECRNYRKEETQTNASTPKTS